MKIVRSATHRSHFPKGELCNGELVRPFESPERVDHVNEALADAGLSDVVVYCMEGGYAVAEIGTNTVNVLTGPLDA